MSWLNWLGDIFGEITGTNKTNAMTARMFRENMQWQSQEAEIARQFQSAEAVKQNQFNADQWQKAFDLTNQYNSPSNQIALMRQAGLNPSVIYAGGSAPVSTASMGSPAQSAGLPSGHGVGSASSPSFQPTNVLGGLQMLSGFFKDMASANKMGAETSRINKMVTHEVENYILKNKGQQYANEISKVNAWVEKNIKDDKVKAAYYKVQDLRASALLKGSEKDLNEAREASEGLNQLLTSKNISISERQIQELDVRLKNLQRMYDDEHQLKVEEAGAQKASAAASYASAEESSASAEQTRIFNKLYNDARFRHSFMSQVVDDAKQKQKQLQLSDKQIKQLEYMCEQLQYANSNKEITYWSNMIFKLVETTGSAASQFYGAGALRELMNLRGMMAKPQLHSGAGYHLDSYSGVLLRNP